MVDPVTDEMQAIFLGDSHFKLRPKGANLNYWSMFNFDNELQSVSITAEMDPEIIPQELLRKYTIYAKLNVFPRFDEADLDKLILFHAELRDYSNGHGVPIAERHIESVIRMSEAHARMHLKQHVTQEDVDMAIRVLLNSLRASNQGS